MKKRNLRRGIILGVLLCLLLFYVCICPVYVKDDDLGEYSEYAWKVDARFINTRVVITVVDEPVLSGAETIDFYIKNKTFKGYTIGKPYYLQVLEDNKWRNVPMISGASWDERALLFHAYDKTLLTMPVSEWYGILPQGNYRVIVCLEDDICAVGEFTVIS